jgi:glyoxylase-like metal-dependent hydrolase (beta-lactamase superfamily II)
MRFPRRLVSAAIALAIPMVLGGAAPPAPPAPVQLWRLDCGSIWVADLDEYSDTHAYVGQHRRFTASCYLIRHGDSYMLWDTGLSKDSLGKPLVQGAEESESLKITIVDQLARLGVKPGQVSLIGISHYHFDHTGQAADFPRAKLLIGAGDLDALRQPGAARAKPLAPWISGGAPVEGVVGDKDVFGDGQVVMLDLPGHTPGHHGLLVRLSGAGVVLLSGDAAHFRENLETGGVPGFNADRARSLASMDRLRGLARNLHAALVIQHDERDIAKLPAFPQPAQ